MPHINGYNGLVTAVETALGQPIPEPAPTRRRRKPLPLRLPKPPTKWAHTLVYWNLCELSDTPTPIHPGEYYLTDRILDGLVTIRYADTGLVPNPETRDSGLRYTVYGHGEKPCYALLAKLKCTLDTRGGPDASAFCLLRYPDHWLPRDHPAAQLFLPQNANLGSSWEYARPVHRRNSIRDMIYRWHIKRGAPPPKLVPSSAVRRFRREIQAVPTPHSFGEEVNAAYAFNRALTQI